jgi:hypothetical protein
MDIFKKTKILLLWHVIYAVMGICAYALPPTNIFLAPSAVNEGQPIGTIVGTLSTTDPDPLDTFTYLLVSGAGSTNNSRFTIDGNTLKTNAVFDFDTKSSYSVRIRSTDSGSEKYEKVFTISILNINQTPTNITLTPSTVNEGKPIGSAVGTLSTIDPDTGDTFTYILVPGTGGTDNSSFTIDGHTLKTNAVFDFDTKSSYSVRIRSTDSGAEIYEKVFTISILNINQPPANITLAPSSVHEGKPIGTIVGILSTADPDSLDTFIYSLVAGTGGNNNNKFTIDGNTLKTKAVFDFDTKSSYSVRIRSTDSGTEIYEKAFTITIIDTNQPPTNITLTRSSIYEGQPIGTKIGTLSTIDPDSLDSFIYMLVAGTGGIDNTSFSIDDSTLKTKTVLDFDTKSSYSIRIRSTDSGTEFYEKVFTITVIDTNQPPTNITLTPSTINEGQPIGTKVGTLSTNDPDAGDKFTYILAAGAGDIDNSSFSIHDSALNTNAVFNFDTKSSYFIRVRSTDSGSLSFEKFFAITVLNVNHPPTDITLTPATVSEGQPIGSTVGILSSIDSDLGDSFTYKLVKGAGDTNNNSFTISGNILRTAAVFDYNIKRSYTVRIRSTDNDTLKFEKIIIINIINVNQPPTDIILAPSNINENEPVGTLIGIFSSTDIDLGDIFTYSLVSGAGSNDNISFEIIGNELRTKVSFNYELKHSFSIRVKSTDNGGASFEKILIVTINNLNELPTDIALIPSSIKENRPLNTLIGLLSTVDPDSGQVFTYSFTPGTGSADNQRFIITGSELRSQEVFDHETKPVCYIRIKTTNGIIESFEKALLVTILDSTEAPVISGIETSSLVYREDDPAKIVSSSLLVNDEDSPNLYSATIQISSNYLNTEDSLHYEPASGISVSYINSGTITAVGKASLLTYQNFLRKIRYKNFNSSNPNINQRTIRFIASDSINLSLPAYRYIQIVRVNDPPVATNLSITARDTIIGELLSAHYIYTDPDEDPQGNSTFNWYTATSNTGLNKTTISGAITNSYNVTYNEGGKYISFAVSPVDLPGLHGTIVNSRWYYINAAPEFTDSTIKNNVHPGVIAVGEIITANFPYHDKENNLPGVHEYRWYYSSNGDWSSSSAITGQNDQTYTISNLFNNGYIAVKAKPHAISGSLSGKEYRTNWYPVSELPTATLSGSVSICQGASLASLGVILTGSSPWTLTYKVNNSIPFIIRDIYSIDGNYQLSVYDTGTYTLLAVSDLKYSVGKVTGIGRVQFLPSPQAQLTQEILSICSNDTSTFKIPITLSGEAPWQVTYTVDGANPKTINFITPTGASFNVNYKTKGLYSIITVNDAICESPGSGQTNVIEKISPQAYLSGDTTVCASQKAILHFSLSGNGPWTLYYKKDKGSVDSLYVNQNVTTYNYSLPVSLAGNYILTGVKDTEQAGCAFNSANIKHFDIPRISFSGDSKICEGSSGILDVHMSGTPPWYFSYDINGSDTTLTSAIWHSPFILPVNKTGVYRIYSITDAHCQGTTLKTASVTMVPPPKVTISIADNVYPFDLVYAPISFYPPGGSYTKSDKPYAFLLNDDDTLCFSPMIAGIGPSMVRYQYADKTSGCIGKDSVQITVIGLDGLIQLKDKTLDTLEKLGLRKLCFNMDPILIEGFNPGNDTGVFKISGPLSDPPELIDNKNNTAYIYPSVIQSGTRFVTFSYKVGSTNQEVSRKFTFEKIDADFKWDNDCFSGTTRVNFSDTSKIEVGSTLVHHLWNFKFPTTIKKYDASKIGVDFYTRSTYPIEYTVISNYGCTDTIRKNLEFIPTINPKESDYLEDFTDGSSYWSSHSLIKGSLNTWKLERPQGQIFNTPPGTIAWYTDITDLHAKENSCVTSPCFNFYGAERPMIKMHIWRAFSGAPEIDGAVLQYSTDNGQSWKTIGEKGDEINWYNAQSIEGSPGFQQIGWSGVTGSHDNRWVECRHELDMLIGKPRVKFRIAYGAPNRDFERDGFAFDDVWIGERSKKVVMEHFTNAGSETCKVADSTLNFLANKHAIDLIDLQYHMDGPGIDTFNILNPFPAFSKSIYYDLPDVPYAVMNGGMNGSDLFDFNNNIPKEKDIILSVLNDNKFYVRGNALYAGDVLSIGIDIEALEDRSPRPITVHVAIIENEIKGITGDNGQTVFKSVVRELISSEPFNHSWVANTTKEHIDLDWDIVNIFNREELRVVTYVQDEITHEIYQASIDNPNVETGIKENFTKTGRNFFIYPNPTSGRTSIQWKNPLESNIRMEITDNLGRLVWQRNMLAGEQINSISLEGLDAGTYSFRAISSNGSRFESQKITLISNR